MTVIQFSDKSISYDAFMNDLAQRVAEKLATIDNMPKVLSQRKAYSEFGRANVERWVKQNKVHPAKRVGKVEYKTAELRKAQSTIQDYF